MKDKIDKIRKACIKANPEKDFSFLTGDFVHLADVLLAMPVGYFVKSDDGYFMQYTETDYPLCQECFWNLKENSLELQSEETINFIHELLN